MNNMALSFFRKPIVPITAVICFVYSIAACAVNMTGALGLYDISGESFFGDITFYIVNVFLLISLAILFLLYICIKYQPDRVSVTAIVFIALAGSEILFYIVLTVLLLLFFIAVQFILFSSSLWFFPFSIASSALVTGYSVIFGFIILICILTNISKILFGAAAYRNVYGEKIRYRAALFNSIMSFLSSVTVLLCCVGLIAFGLTYDYVLLNLGVLFAPLVLIYILTGVISFKYYSEFKKLKVERA